VLANQGLSDAAFTALQRERLAMAQKDDLLFNTAFITPAQAQNAWRLNEQTRAFDYVTINLGMFKANVTDAQIAAHYNAKKDNYKAPERMQVEYVLLDRDTLPPATPPDAAVIKALFDADPKRFITEEGRTVRHLLVSFAGDKPENKLAAKAKADILLKEIKAGGDFALLAKANSGDTGSAENGGLLPDPVRQDGQMVPAFEKAVFAAKVGEVTEPVETQYGYHLIRVDAIQPKAARSATDPTVVAELILDYQRKDAEKRFKALSDELEKLAFENPTSLEAVVKATKVPAKSTDWFTRSTAAASSELVNITTSEDIRAAAFAKNVAQEGDNSTPVTLKAGQQVVVLRKKAYEAARQRTLAEATPEIRAELEVQSNTAQAKARAEALLKVVQAGQSLATVAAAQNLSLNSVAAGKRDRTDATPELVKRAFALPRPTAKPSADSITLRTGDVVLIQLTNVTDVPAADEKSEAFLQFAARQRDEANNTLREAFRKALESRIPSKVLKAPVASVTAP
jgi:peptidyl-prolyl cis-trans isomerase D